MILTWVVSPGGVTLMYGHDFRGIQLFQVMRYVSPTRLYNAAVSCRVAVSLLRHGTARISDPLVSPTVKR